MSEPLIVRACRLEPVERTPVWFMRQAGRSLPEYRALRGESSILDAIMQETNGLQRTLGTHDRAAVSDYLESVREIERRIQNSAVQVSSDISLPEEPVGIPYSYEQHLNLMYDMIALAYQANITRVFTFMVAREESVQVPRRRVAFALIPWRSAECCPLHRQRPAESRHLGQQQKGQSRE